MYDSMIIQSSMNNFNLNPHFLCFLNYKIPSQFLNELKFLNKTNLNLKPKAIAHI